jgi:hypothetical protein
MSVGGYYSSVVLVKVSMEKNHILDSCDRLFIVPLFHLSVRNDRRLQLTIKYARMRLVPQSLKSISLHLFPAFILISSI